MRIYHGMIPAVLAFVLSSTGQTAFAEIYKWVDENGDVHFGDKPLDARDAEKAEKVEIHEAYQPPARTEQELESIRQGQEDILNREAERRREQQRLAAEEDAQRASEKGQYCRKLAEQINKLSQPQIVNGRRTRYFETDEQGNSISASEQEDYVSALKAKSAEEGCPQTWSE